MRCIPLVVAAMACGGSSKPTVDASFAPCTPTAGTDLALEEVARGLTRPLFVTSPPRDGRLFVVEQPGRIRIVDGTGVYDTPFLDIDDRVNDLESEQGLLGLAFHPQYPSNGRFFVNYTRDDGATVIAEYAVSPTDPNVADRTETVLLTVPQFASNHNAGMLAFGPDGLLYIGLGDGGGGGDPEENGQDPTTLLGSMLRIDVDSGQPYGIPASNPYADGAGGARPELWAIGLRNPWRYSFDRDTGDLYIADVGQGDVEEINVQPASSAGGENYGWDNMEGSACFEPATGCDTSGLITPVAEYTHSNGACSVTGGYVYRGSCLPDLVGAYVYGDYCTNQIWTLRYPDDTTPVEQSANLGTDVLDGLSSFGEDENGELYVTSLRNGRIYRIVAELGSNQ